MTTLSQTPQPEARTKRVESALLPDSRNGEPPRTATLSDRMAHHKTPGVSIAVIDGGRVIWARGYGVREAGKPDPVTSRTLFQAGSISKSVTAVMALRLVEAGDVELDEDVNLYLSSWKVPANAGWQPRVTLRQLLSHTAGLTVHGFPGYAKGEPVPSAVQVLDGAEPANTEPVRVNILPGVQHRYSGGGTTIVQQMIEDVRGAPFSQIAKELVFDPLGLNDSTYEQPLPEAYWSSAATAHPKSAKPLAGRWHTYPEMAAAGLWTTASDLAWFAVELQQAKAGESDRLLKSDTVREMFTAQVDDAVGLGVFLEGSATTRRFGHGGWDEGFVAKMTAYQDRGLGAVVMLNSNQGHLMMEEILRAIATEYEWPDYLPAERTPAEIDPSIYESCAGEYELRPEFLVTIATSTNHLLLRVAGQDPVPIQPQSNTTFYASVIDAEVTFNRNGNGLVDSLTLRQGGRQSQAPKRGVEGTEDKERRQ